MAFSFNRMVAGIAMTAALAGCSEPAPATRPQGSLSAGTAEVTIDGVKMDATHDVRCTSGGAVTTIVTGDEERGTTSAVDTGEGRVVQFAQIRDLAGFTGSYWADLNPRADVEMAGQTFVVNGTAEGFRESNPSARISQSFSIRVAC